jgi:hypothetical protein
MANQNDGNKTTLGSIQAGDLGKANGGLLNNVSINAPVNVNNNTKVGSSNISAKVGPISFMSKLGNSVKKGIGKLK